MHPPYLFPRRWVPCVTAGEKRIRGDHLSSQTIENHYYMKKYIDADILRVKITDLCANANFSQQEAMKESNREDFVSSGGEIFAYAKVLSLIDSLQQEQREVDLVAELKHHLATTPKEQLEKEWKELEPWSNIGPTVQEFLYGKQPEVDLEKEIDACWQNWLSPSNQKEVEGVLPKIEFAMYARHFWNKGYNARKEENK